jgi:integrase/recombinase XerD
LPRRHITDSLTEVYKQGFAIERHRAVPLVQEREEFLGYLLRQGFGLTCVQNVAVLLLRAIRVLKLKEMRDIDRVEIENAVQQIWRHRLPRHKITSTSQFDGCHSAYQFRWAVTKWLRFHHKFKSPKLRSRAFEKRMDGFTDFMKSKGFASSTIETNRAKVTCFLRWFATRHKALSRITVMDVSKFISAKKSDGWAVASLCSTAESLRSFFRYAETKGWCREGFAECIRVPRRSSLAIPSQGRTWAEVRKLLGSLNGKDHASTRAKAALYLISMYALRGSEAARLKVSDFDWRKKTLSVRRSKDGSKQRYPLRSDVARAVLNYIKVRPRIQSDQLFLTIKAPFRPVRQRSFYALTSHRLGKLGISTGRRGPHSIRHARAMQLLSQGASLKEIGDFLGHRNAESPLTYAKFNVEMLRPVADFKLGRLL